MNFYRYRTPEYGLRELEDNYIFFPALDLLNDPAGEGKITLYWKGDRIAWQGLLKNYICSLYHSFMITVLGGNVSEMKKHASIADINAFSKVPIGKTYQLLQEKFLHKDTISYLINELAEYNQQLYEDKLKMILFMVHNSACGLVLHEFSQINDLYKELEHFLVKENRVDNLENYKIILQSILSFSDDEISRIYYMISDYIDMWLIDIPEEKKEDVQKVIELFREFPSDYLSSLKNYIHPEAYIACFSKNPHDEQMWGNYADKAGGICIIYKANTEKDVLSLSLYKEHSYSWNDKEGTHIDYQYENIPFQKVHYDNKVHEVNFFTTIGRLSGQQLKSWLESEDGEQSVCLKEIYKDIDQWRKNYWQLFTERYHRKSTYWAHEEEERLIIDNSFWDYSNAEKRSIKVNPENIVGVILGPDMSLENTSKYKLTLRKLIEAKKYPVFDVYQEYEKDGKLTYRRIPL
jgi:hypothetical protein